MRHWYRMAACAAGLAGVLGAGPAQAADDGPIAITIVREGDPEVDIREGDLVAYAITLENTGEAALEGLQVSHLLPAGFALRDARPSPDRLNGAVGWTVSLEPGERIAIADSVEAGTGDQIEQGQLVVVEQPDRSAATGDGTDFTTTACVAGADGEILSCASDRAALLDPEPATGPAWWRWAAAALAAAAGAVILGLGVRKTRRRAA
ncbi:hypothetical protein AB0K52_12720 [Glycomyces sp. NPDC049804]|uniref:hypothetical protein n=1 Tax=Glycomyces sp. NPDC049804 TaxID=3154363 RepID=UPI00341FAB81